MNRHVPTDSLGPEVARQTNEFPAADLLGDGRGKGLLENWNGPGGAPQELGAVTGEFGVDPMPLGPGPGSSNGNGTANGNGATPGDVTSNGADRTSASEPDTEVGYGHDDTPYEDASHDDTPYEDASHEDTSYEDTSYEDASYEDASYEDASYEDATYEDTSYEDASYEARAFGETALEDTLYGREIFTVPGDAEDGWESDEAVPAGITSMAVMAAGNDSSKDTGRHDPVPRTTEPASPGADPGSTGGGDAGRPGSQPDPAQQPLIPREPPQPPVPPGMPDPASGAMPIDQIAVRKLGGFNFLSIVQWAAIPRDERARLIKNDMALFLYEGQGVPVRAALLYLKQLNNIAEGEGDDRIRRRP